MSAKRKISFLHFKHDETKSRVLQHDGDRYVETLRVRASAMSSVLDRLGKDLLVTKASDGVATACVTVIESPTFYGWLTQFGDEVTLVSPESSRKKYMEYLKKLVETYEGQ